MNQVIRKLGLLGERFAPISARFEVTNRCNASCRYCYIPDKSTATDMDTSTVLRIIDKLADSGIFTLTFTGGEIFCREDFSEILSHALKRDFFHIHLMTNGTLIQNDQLRFLESCRDVVTMVSMTVFSHIEDDNDGYFRVPGAYQTIMTTARKLRDCGITVAFSLNVVEWNLDTFVETRSRIEELGFSVNIFYPPVQLPLSGDPQYFGYLTSPGFYREFLSRLPDAEVRGYAENRFSKRGYRHVCSGLKHLVVVDAQGFIRPCISFFGMKGGHILEPRPLSEILRSSPAFLKARNLSHSSVEGCRSCRYLEVCCFCPGSLFVQDASMNTAHKVTCTSLRVLEEVARERGVYHFDAVA